MLSWAQHSFLYRVHRCHVFAFRCPKMKIMQVALCPSTSQVLWLWSVVCEDMLPRTYRCVGCLSEQRLQEWAWFGGIRRSSPKSCRTEHTFHNLGRLHNFCPAGDRQTEKDKFGLTCISLIFSTFYRFILVLNTITW